jgi:hypothetical protein
MGGHVFSKEGVAFIVKGQVGALEHVASKSQEQLAQQCISMSQKNGIPM